MVYINIYIPQVGVVFRKYGVQVKINTPGMNVLALTELGLCSTLPGDGV